MAEREVIQGCGVGKLANELNHQDRKTPADVTDLWSPTTPKHFLPTAVVVDAILALDATPAALSGVINPVLDTVTIRDASAAEPKERTAAVADAFAVVIDRVTANGTDLANSNSEQTLYTKAIPAGTMGADRQLRLVIVGRYKNASGSASTLTVKVKFGGSTHLNDATASIATNGSERSFELVVNVFAKGNQTTQTIEISRLIVSAATAAAAGIGGLAQPAVNAGPLLKDAITVDNAADQTLEVTITHSVQDPATTMQVHQARLELLPGIAP